MASSTLRKAIGVVKDQTSISLAKVAGNIAPDLEILIVKATSHENEPADEKYIREILNMISNSRGYLDACVYAISKRLSKTRDWIVALKSLMLVHRLLNDGNPDFALEMMLSNRKGARVLNISDFRDEAHSNSWDQSGFVRTYSFYLDEKLEFMVYEKKLSIGVDDEKMYGDGFGEPRGESGYGMFKNSRSYGNMNDSQPYIPRNDVTHVQDLDPGRILERLNLLLQLLHRFLDSKPTGSAKNTRMVLIALHYLVRESFTLYADISDVLNNLLEFYPGFEYAHCAQIFDVYVNAAKKIDELYGLYSCYKDIGVVRSSEFPEVRRINDKLLGTLEETMREKRNRPKSPIKSREETSPEIKALPPPEDQNASAATSQPQRMACDQSLTEDLVNLKDDVVSADQQGNKLALALFSTPGSAKTDEGWLGFATDEDPKVTSAWHNPAAETGKDGWELALVESSSHLLNQKADLPGGFDPLLLNGMYDQGAIRQHVNNTQTNGGSASSVVFPETSKTTNQLLALPAPDGTVQPMGQQDPFAASLSVAPPSYVQIADMEREQQLLTQEQQLWQQYASNGMQGQMGLAQIAATSSYYGAAMQPTPPHGMLHPGGYSTHPIKSSHDRPLQDIADGAK